MGLNKYWSREKYVNYLLWFKYVFVPQSILSIVSISYSWYFLQTPIWLLVLPKWYKSIQGFTNQLNDVRRNTWSITIFMFFARSNWVVLLHISHDDHKSLLSSPRSVTRIKLTVCIEIRHRRHRRTTYTLYNMWGN